MIVYHRIYVEVQLMISTWSKRIITAVAEYENRVQLRHKNTNLSSRTTQVSSVEFPLPIRWDGIVRGIDPTLSSLV
jgi:hypothetical protein